MVKILDEPFGQTFLCGCGCTVDRNFSGTMRPVQGTNEDD